MMIIRHSVILLMLSVACGLAVTAFGKEHGDVLTAGAHITVQPTREWVQGTRLWLAVTIKNVKPRQINGPILESGPFKFHGYSYVLTDSSTGACVSERKYSISPQGDLLVGQDGEPAGMAMPSTFNIKSQERLRLLFPIAWPMQKSIAPGDYKLSLTIHGAIVEVGRTDLIITVRSPTQEEVPVLESLDLEDAEWATLKKSTEGINLPDSLRENTGIGFELLLSKLSGKHEAVSEISEDELIGNIPDVFVPEVQVLRYEILRSRNKGEKAKDLREKLLAQHPGIQFRFDDIEKNNGPMARAIKLQAIKKNASK